MLKILIVFVCRVDAVANQQGIAPILIERIASHIVEYGVGNAFDTLLAGIDFLNSSPAVFDISKMCIRDRCCGDALLFIDINRQRKLEMYNVFLIYLNSATLL